MAGMKVPLGIGAYSRNAGLQPSVVLKNMILEKDRSGAGNEEVMRIQRAGLAPYQSLGSTAVRGLFYMQGLFADCPLGIIGNKLYRFDGSTQTELGDVNVDSSRVQFAATNFGVGILSASSFYFLSKANVLTTVLVPDGQIPVSITSINSYIVVGCYSGEWYWLDPSETEIDVLHFADAESAPDGLVAVKRFGDEVYFMGLETIEVWQATGNPDLILARAAGRTWEQGVMARDTVQIIDSTMFFVGNNGVVYKSGSNPERVSNEGIEERIRSRVANPSALVFSHDGHSFYVLHVPGVGAFAYDVGNETWSEFGSTGLTGWAARTACTMGSVALLGDSATGQVYKLDSTISMDNGSVFERVVSGTVAFNGGRQRVDSLEIWAGSTPGMQIRLRWKDGADTSFTDYSLAYSEIAQDIIRFTRMGAARQPYRTIEISSVDYGVLRISGATVNDGRAR